MKKIFVTIIFILAFVLSTAFESSDSLKIPLKPDTVSVAEVNIKFDKLTVERETYNSHNLEVQLEQQNVFNKELLTIYSELNAKIPDMNRTSQQMRFQAIEEEFGIDKEKYKSAIATHARRTNMTNLLIFLSGIGVLWFFGYSKRSKRVPDLMLHLVQGTCAIGTLFLLRYFILSTIVVINPTYQIIQQLAHLNW